MGADWVGGAALDLGDFIVDDIGDFVVDDIGDFVVDDIGSGVEDSWNWVSDGGNWEAAGKTLGAGSPWSWRKLSTRVCWTYTRLVMTRETHTSVTILRLSSLLNKLMASRRLET